MEPVRVTSTVNHEAEGPVCSVETIETSCSGGVRSRRGSKHQHNLLLSCNYKSPLGQTSRTGCRDPVWSGTIADLMSDPPGFNKPPAHFQLPTRVPMGPVCVSTTRGVDTGMYNTDTCSPCLTSCLIYFSCALCYVSYMSFPISHRLLVMSASGCLPVRG